jgi:hypothetical protein
VKGTGMPEDRKIVVCMTTEDMPIPPMRAFKKTCSGCRKEVWVSYSTPYEEGMTYMCLFDALESMEENKKKGRTNEIRMPTKEQLEEIAKIHEQEERMN